MISTPTACATRASRGWPACTVYADLGNIGSYTSGDPLAVTISSGAYTISGLSPGADETFKVRFALPRTLASGSYDLSASINVSAPGDADGVAAAKTPLNVT